MAHAQRAAPHLARGYHGFASRRFPQATSWRSATDGPDAFRRRLVDRWDPGRAVRVLFLIVILPLSAPARCRSAASIALTASLSVPRWHFPIRTLPNQAGVRSATPSLRMPASPACQKGAQRPTWTGGLGAAVHAAAARFCMGGRSVLSIAGPWPLPSLPSTSHCGASARFRFVARGTKDVLFSVPSRMNRHSTTIAATRPLPCSSPINCEIRLQKGPGIFMPLRDVEQKSRPGTGQAIHPRATRLCRPKKQHI